MRVQHGHQGRLVDVVKKIFPFVETHTNVRKQASLISPTSGLYLELDVWIPDKKIAFEYQDAYHYITKWDSNLPLSKIQKQDSLKQKLMEDRGETLIIVPCWWDGTVESLAETIRLKRPDLVANQPSDQPSNQLSYQLSNQLSYQPSKLPSYHSASSIPSEPPQGFFRGKNVPGIGELMLPSFIASSHFNPNNWWMTEKYDGIRACWDPQIFVLYTRHGSQYKLPGYLFSFLPKSGPLDGEIWAGRGNLGDLKNTKFWHELRFVVFDSPYSTNFSSPYEDRFTQLLSAIASDNYFVIPATCVQCKAKLHLQYYVKNILRNNGEGVVLRAPHSVYQHGRSDLLYKIKAHKADQEALVVEIQSTCILLKLPSGLIFSLDKSEVKIELGVGDIVSFSYSYFLPSGKPVEANVYRVRTDMEWVDVIENYYCVDDPYINDMGRRALNEPTRKAAGYWTSSDGANMRLFFDKLARDHELDPLLPESWYPFTEDVVISHHGGPILYHFQGSIIKALLHIYPEIGFDPSKFTRRYWYASDNRKRVFDNFASRNQFDPLIPDNWYPFTKQDIQLERTAPYLLTYYYGKPLYEMLADVYPRVTFKLGCFKFFSGPYWNEIANRKDFFDSVANKNEFDPLIAENWYSAKNETVMAHPGGSAVLQMFGNSLAKALRHTYTQISFDSSKFLFLSKKYWYDRSNRRRFFDDYANNNGFNPLQPDNWYSLSTHSILSQKGGSSVLNYSGRSLVKSLQDAYPELNFDILKFGVLPRNYWDSFKNRRLFFDSMAKKKGFDPLNKSHWISINNASVILEKGGSSILKRYNNSLHEALKDVYQFGTA